jgi:prepilin-type N-terminal cleavage/methylation domain-containing protein
MRKKMNTRGFTLIELLIALTVGVVVLGAALSFGVSTYRTMEGNDIREGAYRNGRFIGMSLERDMQTVGVGIASTVSFGTLAVWGDTIVILSVPFDPNEAPPYDLKPAAGTDNPLPSGGTCGTYCVNVVAEKGQVDLEVGDLARLQVNDTRRLILVSGATKLPGLEKAIEFGAHTSLIHYTAGLTGDLRLDRYSTFVQKLDPVFYYLDGDALMRATSLNPDGTPAGDVLAYGVVEWDVKMVFLDLDEADQANSIDSDPTNDFDDILGIRVRLVAGADRAAHYVQGGDLYTREFEWRFSPRNLMYERNRL